MESSDILIHVIFKIVPKGPFDYKSGNSLASTMQQGIT